MRLKIVLLLSLSFGFTALSEAAATSLQGHIRTGMVQGRFTGADSGRFAVSSSLELEGEFFTSNRGSLLARATISLDPSSGQFKYIYMGLGQRFYLWSRGRPVEGYYESIYTSTRPKFRFFVEYGIGLAQIQVRSVTDSLSVQSTVVELGGGGGTIYQFSRNFGVSLNLMWSQGFAVSSVAIDSNVIRGMVGITGYF